MIEKNDAQGYSILMDKKLFAPYQLVNAYIREHQNHTIGNVFSDAIMYYKEKGLLQDYAEPFSFEQDVILMSDEEFLRICDQLPIRLDAQEEGGLLLSYSLFPPNYDCYVVRHLNALRVDWHSHDFFELCYVWQGRCRQVTGEMSYELLPGDFLIIPPEVKHKVECVDPDSMILNIMVRSKTFHAVSFSFMTQSNAVASFFRHSLLKDTQSQCLSLHTNHDIFLKRIIKHLCQECYLMPSLFCDFATSIFHQLLCYLMLSSVVNSETLHLPENFSIIQILQDIQEHYDQLTLKTLAQKYYFSEEHLSRLIKKHTGKTFSEILLELRIGQAKLLLSRTNDSIETIGMQVGYHDPASFSRAFKKKEGCTPAVYRQKYHE